MLTMPVMLGSLLSGCSQRDAHGPNNSVAFSVMLSADAVLMLNADADELTSPPVQDLCPVKYGDHSAIIHYTRREKAVLLCL